MWILQNLDMGTRVSRLHGSKMLADEQRFTAKPGGFVRTCNADL